MADPVIAEKDAVVHDDVTGLDFRVVAGTTVPAHLLDAYQASSKAVTAPAKDKAQRAPERTK